MVRKNGFISQRWSGSISRSGHGRPVDRMKAGRACDLSSEAGSGFAGGVADIAGGGECTVLGATFRNDTRTAR